jgi:hypothetical protein
MPMGCLLLSETGRRMIHRRNFLQAMLTMGGAKALPAWAAGAVLDLQGVGGDFGASAHPGVRQAPRRPLFLRSATLAVTLDAEDGLPYSYAFGGETMWGEDAGQPAVAIVCRLHPRSYVKIPLKVAEVRSEEHSVRFLCEVSIEEQTCVRFVLHYAINESSLVVRTEEVVEQHGFELIEVSMPSLVTVRSDEEAGWMAQGRHGGSFVRVSAAKPFQFPDDPFFGKISPQLPVGVLGKRAIGCLMEVTAFMDGTMTSVVEAAGTLRAQIGTVQLYRVHGGRCYDMNDGGPPVSGDATTPNLLVGQTSRCRLDFYVSETAETPWLPAMKMLRARMPPSPTDYYDDKLLYLIAGKSKVDPKPHTTFAQSRKLVEDVAQLTDYAPQVVFLSGWVYDGQDTGYPSDDVVNSSLGTYTELMQLMEHGRTLHANITVNENYDDAYKSSPLFDLAFIAREPNGSVWKSRAWDGEDSYIVGMAKYVKGGWAKRRIDRTMARYTLQKAMLIDALSWFAIRNDWDPEHPASGYRNLVEGKWFVLEEFRRRGVYVASEQFRYPMLGKLALSVDGPSPAHCPFGGEQIPMTAIVFRGSTIFGGPSGSGLRAKESLFWNSRSGRWFEHATDRREITDFYYLVALPYSKVHRLEVEDYRVHASECTIHLRSDAAITMETDGPRYRVVFAGETQNERTTCPVDATKIAFYARKAGLLSYPLPAGWRAAELTARLLTVDGPKSFPVTLEGEQIVVEVPERTPVMVYASQQVVPGYQRT